MSNITPSRDNPVDIAARFKAGLQKARASTVLMSSQPLLRLLKSGKWVFGQQNDVVQAGSKWIVNTASMQHGWACWTDDPAAAKNELKGESMGSIFDDKPVQPMPADGRWPFKEQFSFDLKCMSGEDAGTQVHFKTTSLGGKRAIMEQLVPAIDRQIDIDPVHVYPIMKLEVDSYPHTKYGETFVPIFDIVGWADQEGNAASGPQLVKPAKEPVEEPVEPEATAATRTAAPPRRGRRRPSAAPF
jgi:hypothetical protein